MVEFLKVPEIARRLNVSGATVRRWIALGQIPSVRTPGGQYRVSRTVADALAQEGFLGKADAETAA